MDTNASITTETTETETTDVVAQVRVNKNNLIVAGTALVAGAAATFAAFKFFEKKEDDNSWTSVKEALEDARESE